MLDTFRRLYAEGWTCTTAVIECPPCIIKWRKGSRTIVVLDIANIWTNLAPDGLLHELDNGLPTWDATTLDTSRSELLKTRANYIQSMCVDWWQFLVSKDLGGFSVTAASQSVRTFRHKFMSEEILIDCNKQALALARRAYSGGRTECFHIGKLSGEYFLLDVNSMYCAVMANMQVPTRLIGYTENASVHDIESWCAGRLCVADVDVETDMPMFCARDNKRLIFPLGRFRTTLCGQELQWALQHGCLRSVRAVACYRSRPAFKSYMLHCWRERQLAKARGDSATAEKYKLLANSFYGKWGQAGGKWEKVKDAEDGSINTWVDLDYDTGTVHHWRQFAGIVQHRDIESESYESHPAIAATITANARMVLWSYIVSAGLENTFYCDTDSLLVNRDGLERLAQYIQPSQLGGLRLEGAYHDIDIRAAKDYVFDNRERRKGVSREALAINDDTVEQTENVGLSALIAAGDMSRARARRVRRTFVRQYDKGIVTLSGRVEPFRRT